MLLKSWCVVCSRIWLVLLRRLGVMLFQDAAGVLEKLVCCVLQDVPSAVPLLGCSDVPGPVAFYGTPFLIILGFQQSSKC